MRLYYLLLKLYHDWRRWRASHRSVDIFDLKEAVSENRLRGLWLMMTGFRAMYLAATISLALSALAKTTTYFLLRYLVDDLLAAGRYDFRLALVALGFVGLALFEGGFSYLSGRLAAQTSEGVARRLRNYLYDHIQRLSFNYHDRTPTGELIQRATPCAAFLPKRRSVSAVFCSSSPSILLLFSACTRAWPLFPWSVCRW
jgi:ABC-type multidrug transport system fused ATPase/permease subunit